MSGRDGRRGSDVVASGDYGEEPARLVGPVDLDMRHRKAVVVRRPAVDASHEVAVALRLLVGDLRIDETSEGAALREHEGPGEGVHVGDDKHLLSDRGLGPRDARGRAEYLPRMARRFAVAVEKIVDLDSFLADRLLDRRFKKVPDCVGDGLEDRLGNLVHNRADNLVYEPRNPRLAAGNERRKLDAGDGVLDPFGNAIGHRLYRAVDEFPEPVGKRLARGSPVVADAAG